MIISNWKQFAEVTIKTNDLDPMYAVIAKLAKSKDNSWMGRFLIYFICFYHAGDAAAMADATDNHSFWPMLRAAASVSETRRGAERRHFRGDKAVAAVDKLASFGVSPAVIFSDMWATDYDKFVTWMGAKYSGCQMGPYFYWKIYDIQTVCLGRPILLTFGQACRFLPDEPRKAAERFWPGSPFSEVLLEVSDFISQFDHPVRSGKCGLAEAETILCMMKGFFGTKSHWLGDDIHDKWVQLEGHEDLRLMLPGAIAHGTYTLDPNYV